MGQKNGGGDPKATAAVVLIEAGFLAYAFSPAFSRRLTSSA